MQNNKIVKAYSIKEVSKKINIPTGTIRQWEKDFNGLLFIPRTKQGARFYTDTEIGLLNKIKEMREQNVNKEMIRALLQKHIENLKESPSEVLELSTEKPLEEMIVQKPEINIESFHMMLDEYKQQLVMEIKREMTVAHKEIVEDMKNELATSNLHTIKEISKSIQRSNDKRKGELQEITHTIARVSEEHSETFVTLTEQVADTSKGAFEQLEKKIVEANRKTIKESNETLRKVSKTVSDAKKDMRKIASSIDAKQKDLLETMNDLKQSTEEIQHREEVFQGMLSSFREVAATKARKKTWWKVWN